VLAHAEILKVLAVPGLGPEAQLDFLFFLVEFMENPDYTHLHIV